MAENLTVPIIGSRSSGTHANRWPLVLQLSSTARYPLTVRPYACSLLWSESRTETEQRKPPTVELAEVPAGFEFRLCICGRIRTRNRQPTRTRAPRSGHSDFEVSAMIAGLRGQNSKAALRPKKAKLEAYDSPVRFFPITAALALSE